VQLLGSNPGAFEPSEAYIAGAGRSAEGDPDIYVLPLTRALARTRHACERASPPLLGQAASDGRVDTRQR